jgi:hypothetical protein
MIDFTRRHAPAVEYSGVHGCREVLSRAGSYAGKSTWNCNCIACQRKHVADSEQLKRQAKRCQVGCPGMVVT